MSTTRDNNDKPNIPLYLSQRTLELISRVASEKDEPIDCTVRKLVLFYIDYSSGSRVDKNYENY